MDNRQKIEYLKEYLPMKRELRNIIESCKDIDRDKIYNIQAQIVTDMPITHSAGDRIGQKICILEGLTEAAKNKIDKLNIKIQNIEKAIYGMEKSDYSQLMKLRYIDGYTWETVCYELKYSWRQTHRIHSDALSKIEI